MDWSLVYGQPFQRYPRDRQTNEQRNKQTNKGNYFLGRGNNNNNNNNNTYI